jgi:hypothetical protein
MRWQGLTVVFVAARLSAACGEPEQRGTSPPPADAGVETGLPQDSLCPDPEHPRVHYVNADPNVCRGVTLTCTDEQNGFDNPCGCGCIDKGAALCPVIRDPAVTWVSRDPAECAGPPPCPAGDTPFSNTCGCGCITH